MRRRSGRVRSCALIGVGLLLAACTTAVEGSGSAGPGTSQESADTGSGSFGSDPSGSDAAGTDPTAPADHDRWLPTETNPDPSVDIEGVYIGTPALYGQRYHFAFPDRVAYDRFPPVGGPHDPVWAACNGVVYDLPVRNENMVHSLEHGAVWIAYNPDTIPMGDLEYLTTLVPQVPYLVMTPYPDLATPLSLQAWGHQLALDSSSDPRFEQFVLALIQNQYLTPEPNATCSQPSFDVADPPAFDPTPPGADAIPLDFTPPAPSSSPTG